MLVEMGCTEKITLAKISTQVSVYLDGRWRAYFLFFCFLLGVLLYLSVSVIEGSGHVHVT